MNVETANRLQMLRKKNNLSQEELAEKIGISRQAVSKWERAEASPDTDNLILLAKLYGVTLDDLLKTESVHFPDEDSISLRKEDYYQKDDGEIYPDARPFEYKAAEDPAPEKKQEQATNQDSPDNVGEFVKNVAEFAVNVSKEAISATSKAMKSANESMKNGKSFADSIEGSFEKNFEKFGENVEKMGDSFGKTVEESFKDMDKQFENMDKQFENMDDQFQSKTFKKVKKEKPQQKKYPAFLLDKLFPILITFLFIVFCTMGYAHPMWMLFLFIPVYYILSIAYKKYRAGDFTVGEAALSIFDGIVPFAAALLFIVTGSLFDIWYIAWTVFLLIPIYYIFSTAAKKYVSGRLSPLGAIIFFLNGSVPIIVTILFFLLGFTFSFGFSWIVFFFIPVYYITMDHFRKNTK